MAIKIGDYLYIVQGNKKYLRKCIYAEGNIFEWNYGYASQSQLKINEEKSKVKFILDYT